MTNPFALPIIIPLKPSTWLTSCAIIIHLGAMLAPFFADVHWLWRYVIIFVITFNLIYTLSVTVFHKHPEAPIQLLLTTGEEWWLTCAGGHTLQVQLQPAPYVHPLLTVLSFQGDGRRYRVFLTPDVVDADMFRRLRVRLRFLHDREPAR